MSAEKFIKFFNDADEDHSGELSLDELIAALRRNGCKEGEDKIKAMFNSVDDSGDNLISLDEFLSVMGVKVDPNYKANAMRRVFREFDKNGDGQIDKSELDAVFKELKMHVSKERIDEIMAEVDTDGSQTLDYEEFIKHVYH